MVLFVWPELPPLTEQEQALQADFDSEGTLPLALEMSLPFIPKAPMVLFHF